MGMIIFNIVMAIVCFIFAIAFLVQSFTLKGKLEEVEEEIAEEYDERANARCGGYNVYYTGDVVLTPNVTAKVYNYSTGETEITDIIVHGYSLYDHLPNDIEDKYEAGLALLRTEGLASGTINYVDIQMIEELQSDLWKADRELYYGRMEYNHKSKKFVWV